MPQNFTFIADSHQFLPLSSASTQPSEHEITTFPKTPATTAIMKIPTALSLILALGHGASAYVVRIYSEPGCKGDSKEVNVWDNTCRDTGLIHEIYSVELLEVGAWRQRAHAYASDKCISGMQVTTFWVDGGSIQVGECKSFDASVRALGSQHQA